MLHAFEKWCVIFVVQYISFHTAAPSDEYYAQFQLHTRLIWYNEKYINCEKCINILFSQFINFSSVLLTKKRLRLTFFVGVPGNFDEKMYKIFFYTYFVFSCDEKCINTFAS